MHDDTRTEKSCARCGETKPIGDFSGVRRTSKRTGETYYIPHSWCRPCCSQYLRDLRVRDNDKHRAKGRARYWADPEKQREYQRQRRLLPEVRERLNRATYKLHGLTREQFEVMADSQGGVCAICGSPPGGGRTKRLFVDHDHQTGRIRGLLCLKCNVGLGALGDTAEALRVALRYLEGG